MTNFWDKITDIFRSAENSTSSAPAVHEMIERDNDEVAEYERWKTTLARRRLFDYLSDQYAIYLGGGRTDGAIDFLDTPGSKGFVLHIHRTRYGRSEMTHFFHYLQERVLEFDYRTQISDRRVFSRKDWVETQERHYLKPRTRGQRARGAGTRVQGAEREQDLLQQQFGNITVEFELRDDRPWNLRLRANTYQDSQYAEPESFRALMVALAGTSG